MTFGRNGFAYLFGKRLGRTLHQVDGGNGFVFDSQLVEQLGRLGGKQFHALSVLVFPARRPGRYDTKIARKMETGKYFIPPVAMAGNPILQKYRLLLSEFL